METDHKLYLKQNIDKLEEELKKSAQDNESLHEEINTMRRDRLELMLQIAGLRHQNAALSIANSRLHALEMMQDRIRSLIAAGKEAIAARWRFVPKAVMEDFIRDLLVANVSVSWRRGRKNTRKCLKFRCGRFLKCQTENKK